MSRKKKTRSTLFSILRNLPYNASRGASLLELLIAIVLTTAVVVSLLLIVPKAMRSDVTTKSRGVANHLAVGKMAEIKAKPYPRIAITPSGPYFGASACDCSQVDWSSLGGGIPVVSGAGTYTIQECVNYTQRSGNSWTSQCSQDTGLKQIVINATWHVGGSSQSMTLQSLVAMQAQMGKLTSSTSGTLNIPVCVADSTNLPPGCGANSTALQKAEGYVLNNGSVVAENAHTTINVAGVSYPVISFQLAPNTYDIHVQQTGYFPFHQLNASTVIAGGTTWYTSDGTPTGTPLVVLRDLTTYGTHVVGELALADRPLITKVMSQISDSPCSTIDLSEAVEIYNPTQSTYTFGTAGNANIDLVYKNMYGDMHDLNVNSWPLVSPSATLLPGHYFLITGVDWLKYGFNNPSGPLGVTPDISYPVPYSFFYLYNSGINEGLIPYKSAGEIDLMLKISGTWWKVDSVYWDGKGQAFNAVGSLGFPSIAPNGCGGGNLPTSTNVAVRASRRGQYTQSTPYQFTGAFGPNSGPGSWASSFVGGLPYTTFGSWPMSSPLTFYTSQSPSVPTVHTGAPIFSSYGPPMAQIADPTSKPTGINTINNTLCWEHSCETTIMNVANIMGPNAASSPGAVIPSQWPMVFGSGSFMIQAYLASTTTPVLNGGPGTMPPANVTLLNNLAPPPQPCTGGTSPCDTGQDTVPHLGTIDPNNPSIVPPIIVADPAGVDYGPNPDSLTPYWVLDSPPFTLWSYLIPGWVQDANGNPVSGIPVVASDPADNFVLEKVTDSNGRFYMVFPTTDFSRITFIVNSPTPAGPNTLYTHYYDPHYATITKPGNSPGLYWNLNAGLMNQYYWTSGITLPLNSNGTTVVGLGSISGVIKAAENSTVLPGMTVQLRDSHGYVLFTTTSDVNGSYTFGQLPAGSFDVTLVTEGHQTANPVHLPTAITTGQTFSGDNFRIRGVSALVTLQGTQPGTYAIVYSTSVATGALSSLPVISPQSNGPIYSQLIPGSVTGAALGNPQIQVLPGSAYNLECWTLQPGGLYEGGPAVPINGAQPLSPNQPYSVSCQ